MDIRKLQSFVAVAQLGSLGKASDRLRTAQPALSRQIKLLEHELKTVLFLRNGRGMILTEAGRLLLQRVEPVLKQLDDIRGDIKSLGTVPSGHVVLGMVPTVSCVLAASFARRVAEELPNVSLRIVESYGGHLTEWLHRAEMDLAIIYGPAGDLHLEAVSLGREELMVVGPSSFDTPGPVSLAWLQGQKMVLPSFSHGLRALIGKAMARRNLQPHIQIEADSYRVLIGMVQLGLGLTILPRSAVADEVRLGLLRLAAIEKPPILRELILAAPMERPASVACTAVTRLLHEEIDRLINCGAWDLTRPPAT